MDVVIATNEGARIVNVSSLMHELGCLDFEGSLRGRYRSWKDVSYTMRVGDSGRDALTYYHCICPNIICAICGICVLCHPQRLISSNYNDSKLAMILHTLELRRRLKDTPHVQALVVSPGAVYSDIWRTFGKLYRRFFLDPVMSILFLDNDQGKKKACLFLSADFGCCSRML